MSQTLMIEARVKDLNGKILFLQAPHTTHLPGHHYYKAQYDENKLTCACCNARVIYRGATPSSSGSTFKGRPAYFALAPNQKHEEGCDIVMRPRSERHIAIDRTKGYRIHINTRQYSDAFNDEAGGVYGRNGVILDPDLRDREVKVIKSAQDLVDLIAGGHYKRLNNSKVIFRNKSLNWADFLVRPNADKGHERFIALLKRLEHLRGQETFCAMVVRIEKGHSLTYHDRTVKGIKLPIARKEHGADESIVPQIFVSGPQHNEYITKGFLQPGDYLVMGVPKLRTYNGFQGESLHDISIRIDSDKSFLKVDLQALMQTGQKRAARRKTESALPSPALPTP